MSQKINQLRIKEIRKETPNCVSISFEVPPALEKEYEYKSGQYITIIQEIGNKEVRRAYSMSSGPDDPFLQIAVKEVEDGIMSKYLNQEVRPEETLQVMTPAGHFFVEPDPERRCTYYFFAAGSGITPVLSMVKTILHHEPLSTVYLFYGNRNSDAIIYKDILETLVEKHEGQFFLEHILSGPNHHALLYWEGQKGRISSEQVEYFLDKYPKRTREERFFICGPGKMIEVVKSKLLKMDVELDDIFTEYFNNEHLGVDQLNDDQIAGSNIFVKLNGDEFDVNWDQKNSVLQNLLDAGYDPPYSCESGICTTCMAKVDEGKVHMEIHYGLSQAEIDKGLCLTCQAKPVTKEVKINYDI